jgi:alpha-beta hydrolase superfamily lysophospholipase
MLLCQSDRYFSVVGHSLGGLYARAMLAPLAAAGVFDRIQPVNFVTLAAPHLGCRQLMKRYTQVGSVLNSSLSSSSSHRVAQALTTLITSLALGRTGNELMWFDGWF